MEIRDKQRKNTSKILNSVSASWKIKYVLFFNSETTIFGRCLAESWIILFCSFFFGLHLFCFVYRTVSFWSLDSEMTGNRFFFPIVTSDRALMSKISFPTKLERAAKVKVGWAAGRQSGDTDYCQKTLVRWILHNLGPLKCRQRWSHNVLPRRMPACSTGGVEAGRWMGGDSPHH